MYVATSVLLCRRALGYFYNIHLRQKKAKMFIKLNYMIVLY